MASPHTIHLEDNLDPEILDPLADFICGDAKDKFPTYRSSSYLTRFFQSLNIDVTHDGSTRKVWVLEVLKQLQPSDIEKVILRLVDPREYGGVGDNFQKALQSMNEILIMENLSVGLEKVRPYLKYAEPPKFEGTGIFKATTKDEAEFLSRQFDDVINIQELGFDSVITSYLQQRVDEVQSCPKNKVPLGTIFLLGSTLEGILLAVALKDPAKYMRSKTAPKDRAGVVKKINEWKLAELIDVAYEVDDLKLDVKKFSHVLRDFRNYIHPFHQMQHSFNPNQYTVDICWQVFKAAFYQLKVR
ncbi:MAG TPA: hypothetical protein VIZ18_09775 [Ktedonobacteraceae bacterium]